MWQFNWGVFWAVLAATGVVGFVAVRSIVSALDVVLKHLSDIEMKVHEIIQQRNRT
jgi:hypothetical protein